MTQLLQEFLAAIDSKDFDLARPLASRILQLEPDNVTMQRYQAGLKKMAKIEAEEAVLDAEEEEESSEEEEAAASDADPKEEEEQSSENQHRGDSTSLPSVPPTAEAKRQATTLSVGPPLRCSSASPSAPSPPRA